MIKQTIRIEKRLPIGFVGDWGKLFKLHTNEEKLITDDTNIIQHLQNHYVDIGMDIQFKRAENLSQEVKQALMGGESDSGVMVVKTSDAYWDSNRRTYRCVIDTKDIVSVFGRRWLVNKIYNKRIDDLARHDVYYMTLENM